MNADCLSHLQPCTARSADAAGIGPFLHQRAEQPARMKAGWVLTIEPSHPHQNCSDEFRAKECAQISGREPTGLMQIAGAGEQCSCEVVREIGRDALFHEQSGEQCGFVPGEAIESCGPVDFDASAGIEIVCYAQLGWVGLRSSHLLFPDQAGMPTERGRFDPDRLAIALADDGDMGWSPAEATRRPDAAGGHADYSAGEVSTKAGDQIAGLETCEFLKSHCAVVPG